MERGSACIIELKEFMSEMQELLNQEAMYANTGRCDSEERKQIHTLIRLKREQSPPPCFGEDDCSTLMLSMCPWRIDCGDSELMFDNESDDKRNH